MMNGNRLPTGSKLVVDRISKRLLRGIVAIAASANRYSEFSRFPDTRRNINMIDTHRFPDVISCIAVSFWDIFKRDKIRWK